MNSQPSTGADSLIRLIRTPAYLILTMAMVLPLADYANGLLPLRLGDPIWRFGALGLVASYALATTAQLFFLFVIAAASGDRRILLTIAIVAALATLALLGGSGLYLLDTIQTRARTSAGTQTRLEAAAAVVMLKFLFLLIGNAVLVRAALRARGRGKPATGVPGDQMLIRRSAPVAAPRV